jgi:hypothetical protein
LRNSFTKLRSSVVALVVNLDRCAVVEVTRRKTEIRESREADW